MKVGLEGNFLVEDPYSPHALNLRQWVHWVNAHNADLQVEVLAPNGTLSMEQGTGEADPQARPHGERGWRRLLYEQRNFPRMAKERGMDLALYSHAIAPLSSPIPVACLAGIPAPRRSNGWGSRLGSAFGAAGLGGATAQLWPDDLLPADPPANCVPYPPLVHPDFSPSAQPTDRSLKQSYPLPEDYVLVHGENDIRAILAAWTWVVSGTGDYYTLLILGNGKRVHDEAHELALGYGIESTVHSLPGFNPDDLAALYRSATALVSAGSPEAAPALRWAMASGVPAASYKTFEAEAVLREAGYLVEMGRTRRLGAALLSLLVQNELAEEIRQKGLRRARAYQSEQAHAGLADALLALS